MRTLPADFVTEKQKLTQTAPWIWLLECRVDENNAIRAAKYTTSVTWPAVTGDTFHGYPITFTSRLSQLAGHLGHVRHGAG